MTPAELLEEAKDHFVVLYHNDETKLASLLKRALRKFQEKAGVMTTLQISEEQEGVVSLPSDFLDMGIVLDNRTVYHDYQLTGAGTGLTLTVEVQDNSEYPFTVHYFQNLEEWGLDTPLPSGTTGLLLDYLIALIAIPNTDRERAIVAASGQQVELPSRQELEEKLVPIESSMAEARAIAVPCGGW